MKSLEYLERLLEYDAWANQEVLNAMRAAEACPPKALKYMAHVLAAEQVWLSRLLQDGEKVVVWPEQTLEECAKKASTMAHFWRDYVGGLTESQLAQPVSYRNSKGEQWESTRGDILMHVVMHSAYHRGQIAAEMRAAGLQPAYTDFIHAVRQGLAA
jgi:uncharacterized damage-inducible protein DinB